MVDEADVAWCSWCYEKTSHRMATTARYGGLSRGSFHCANCERPTTTCRAPGCKNFARIDENYADAFCAAHQGTISSFETLGLTIRDPTEIIRLFNTADSTNYASIIKTASIGLAAAVAALPLAVIAAPAIGGAVGVSLLGLSGAAAKSAGLAYLGLGSLAAGGAGVAGGTTVVLLAGSALGGWLGAVVANQYYREVDGFSIEKIRDGKDPAILCIDGFLTEGKNKSTEWLNGLDGLYSDRAIYRVHWEAQTLSKLANLAGDITFKQTLGRVIASKAAHASAAAAGVFAPVAAAISSAQLASNPWWVALSKARQTGTLVADAICRCEGREFIIIGHSLGARVAMFALLAIGTKELQSQRSKVIEAHLMGGAVDLSDPEHWQLVASAVESKIYNYYSSHDGILQYAYKAASFFRSTPIGLAPIPVNETIDAKVLSIDCSSKVKGHEKYHENIKHILVVPRAKKMPFLKRLFWTFFAPRTTRRAQS
ncbi:MAG: DUF726 domain-containing protein [Hyphomicrobiaceae bacterium]